MNYKKIVIGCDHAGFPYKGKIVSLLKEQDIEVQDYGTHSPESVDYPDYVHPVARQVEKKEADLGIVLCGSGNGVAMTVNKYAGVRAAICWLPELASLARQHNDANILALPVRFISEEQALTIVDAFLNAEFEGGRHTRRVGKINQCI